MRIPPTDAYVQTVPSHHYKHTLSIACRSPSVDTLVEIEHREVDRGGLNPELQHSTLLIVLRHQLLLLQVQPSIYTEVKVIGNVCMHNRKCTFTYMYESRSRNSSRAKEQVNLSIEVPLVPF